MKRLAQLLYWTQYMISYSKTSVINIRFWCLKKLKMIRVDGGSVFSVIPCILLSVISFASYFRLRNVSYFRVHFSSIVSIVLQLIF